MRVLVTGATGFVGRQCLPLLRKAGYEVHTVSTRAGEPDAADVHHVADLLLPGAAERLVAESRPTHLLHLAWYAVHRRFWTAPENLDWVAASIGLFRAFSSSGGKRAVLAGTCAEYDWSGSGLCSEHSTPLVPATLYGVSKNALRTTLASFTELYGPSTAWGRVFFLYGPHEQPTRLVASVIGAMLRGIPAPCSSGDQVRDFLHVSDVASAFVALLGSELSGPVNIASGEGVALKDMLGLIANEIGRPDLLQLGALPTPANEPPLLIADVGRLRDEMGWRPSLGLAEGLVETIDWWRTRMGRPERPEPV